MPFSYFIDGLSIDKYGKLSVEAVLIIFYDIEGKHIIDHQLDLVKAS